MLEELKQVWMMVMLSRLFGSGMLYQRSPLARGHLLLGIIWMRAANTHSEMTALCQYRPCND